MTILYQTRFVKVGAEARTTLEVGFLITFRDMANNQDMEEYCFVHTHSKLERPIAVGDTLVLGSHRYPVTAVGEVANTNLAELGHISIYFDGKDSANLPGAIHVNGSLPEDLDLNDEFTFLA